MKRIFLLILTIFPLSLCAQKSINLITGTQTNSISNTKPTRSVSEIPSGYLITYKFDYANIYQDEFYPNTYEWRINDYGLIHETTKPSLPVRYESFIVPEGKSIKITLVNSTSKDFATEIAPAKPNQIEDRSFTSSDIPLISNYSGFYPNNLVDIVDTQFFRNTEIATISISPFQYDKINKKIRANHEICFKIEFENKITPLSIEDDVDDEGRLKFQFSTPYMSGYDGTGTVYTNPSGPSDPSSSLLISPYIYKNYLILSTPEFKDAVEKLCEWKRTIGFQVQVNYNNEWTVESVKTAIEDFASSHPNFTHLLFIGGYDNIPSISYISPINSYENYYSDMEYACLNGPNDKIPDVIYGRIPAYSLEEANTIIEKSINYEKNPTGDEAFFNNHLFTALFYTPIIDNNNIVKENYHQYTETCENIRSKLSSKGYNSDFAYKLIPYNTSLTPTHWNSGESIPGNLRYPNYNWNGNASDINNSINKGASTILYRGHGNEYSWYQIYNTANIKQLSNENKTPVVFSIACSTGKLQSGKCFAETFLNIKNGGCSSIIAATEKSYTILNNYYAMGLYQSIWPEDKNFQSTYEIGAIMQTAYDISGHFDMYGLYQRRIYHCYGDPSMHIYTSSPKEIENVTVTREKSKISVSSPIPMYISFYNPETKEATLAYGKDAKQFYAQDRDGNIETDTQSIIVTVYNHNYKPKSFTGLSLRPRFPVDTPLSLDNCEWTDDENLEVNYVIPNNVQSADIIVCDVFGNRKLSQECNIEETSSVIYLSGLKKGVYIISLEVDRYIIDSKRIIK